MRNLITKLTAGSALVGAALLVAACGHHDTAANTADTNMTDMNTMDSSAGMTNDMSATDATANDANMAMDNGATGASADNGTAPANQM
jgi:hypothetical protein